MPKLTAATVIAHRRSRQEARVTGFDTGTGVPPAWYPDPQGPSLLRWWDGTVWTARTMQRPGSPVEVVPRAEVVPTAEIVPTEASAPPVVAPTATTYVPMAEFATAPARRDHAAFAEPQSSHTTFVWGLALYPLLQLVLAIIITAVAASMGGTAPQLAVGGSSFVFSLICAYNDSKILKSRGFRPPGWGWAVLPLVYFILRAVRVGRSSLGPLFTWAGIQTVFVAIIVLAVALPVFLSIRGAGPLSPSERAELLTPTGMAESVAADLEANDYDVAGVVCPPLESVLAGSSVRCQADTATSTLYVVVEVTPADPDHAYVISSGWEADK